MRSRRHISVHFSVIHRTRTVRGYRVGNLLGIFKESVHPLVSIVLKQVWSHTLVFVIFLTAKNLNMQNMYSAECELNVL